MVSERSDLYTAMEDLFKDVLGYLPHITGRIEIDESIDAEHDVVPHYDQIYPYLLTELIRNAAVAMKDNSGTLILRIDKHGGNWIFSVEDNGPGIPPENLCRIFERGFTTKKRGTGKGLSLIKSRVESQIINGTMTVQSEFGKGATFRITIPE